VEHCRKGLRLVCIVTLLVTNRRFTLLKRASVVFEDVAERPAFRSNSPEDNGTVSMSKESGARSVAFGLCSVDDFQGIHKRITCII
jgi:hypothetical protein